MPKNKQTSLFNEHTTSSEKKIAIIFSQETKANKGKDVEKISKKLEKIEQLKSQIEKSKLEIEKIKNLYKKHATETELLFYQAKEAYVVALSEKFLDKGFTKWQQDVLYNLIQEEINLLNDMKYSSEVLTSISSKVDEHYSANMSSFDKEIGKEMFKNFMQHNGFDFDEDDFSFDDISNPNFMKDFAEKHQRARFEQQQKQQEDESREKILNTDIDFQKIYKKLVKLVHPDLVKTEKEKLEKEILMKRLTQAWENRDYLELIILQQIIDVENTIAIEFSEKNIKTITKQLNEKINNLEQEKYIITSKFGPNHFYFHNFRSKNEAGIIKKIDAYTKILLESVQEAQKNIVENLKNKSTTKKYLEKIYQQEQDAEFDFMSFLNKF
jgi:hypothetical protein